MRNSPYINPTVKTFETDTSDKPSPYSKTTSKGSGDAPSGEESPGGGSGIAPPPINNLILQENGFYLLQEDDNKIII